MLSTLSRKINWTILAGISLSFIGICIRWVYILSGRFPFNSDEAIVGLMARHILKGERPTFFYGQAYMGSLDAWLNAISFWAFGESIIAMRITQTLLWIILLFSVHFLAKSLFSSSQAGWIAVILTANPVVNVFLYTTISLGGYNEALIIGIWSLIIVLQILKIDQNQEKKLSFFFLILGFLIGFGLWSFAFALVFSIPAVFMIIWNWIKRGTKIGEILGACGLIIAGFILGSLPWWIFGIQNGLNNLIIELTGSAVAVEGGSWIARAGSHLLNFILLGISVIFGFRAPWSISWLVLPAIPFILMIWIWLLRLLNLNKDRSEGYTLVWLVIGFEVFCFAALSFGVDPSGRYFIPITILLNVLAAGGLFFVREKSRLIFGIFLTILIIYPFVGTILSNQQSQSGFTSQFAPNTEPDHERMDELTNFLLKNRITRGYTDYWVSYPLAFNSKEQLIFTPELPYHRDFRYTERDNRYDPYKVEVIGSDQIAYIVDQFPELAGRIKLGLTKSGSTWKEKVIGGYLVIYDLTEPIRPDALNLYRQDITAQ